MDSQGKDALGLTGEMHECVGFDDLGASALPAGG